jgi:hypothetical protein
MCGQSGAPEAFNPKLVHVLKGAATRIGRSGPELPGRLGRFYLVSDSFPAQLSAGEHGVAAPPERISAKWFKGMGKDRAKPA